jgi:DNA-binding transcriptional LysR family regulator
VNLHQLRIFESISRHLNVTSAARELHMSQPAVSSQLKLLEQEYSLKFYERSNRGMKMTQAGQDFLHEIRPVLARLDEVELQFKNGGQEIDSPVLTVGGSNTLSVTVFPEILLDFKSRHPEVHLVVESRESRALEASVLEDGVEIALITDPAYFADCTYEPYRAYEAAAFVSTDSTITGDPMSLADLTAHPLIVRRGSICVDELRRRGYKPDLAVQCDAPDAVKAAVQRGLGVGLLFRGRVEREIEKGDLRLLDVPEMKEIKIESFIVYDGRKPLTTSAQDFLQTLHKSIA